MVCDVTALALNIFKAEDVCGFFRSKCTVLQFLIELCGCTAKEPTFNCHRVFSFPDLGDELSIAEEVSRLIVQKCHVLSKHCLHN